jgi:hypothetical protein
MLGTAPSTEVQDLAWLSGELESLMPMLDVIPFDEKPGDLPSFTELLLEWYEICLIRHTPALGLPVRPFARPVGLEAILNATLTLRVEWITHLRASDLDPETLSLLRQIIRQERGLFKQLAERIMTIQKPVP